MKKSESQLQSIAKTMDLKYTKDKELMVARIFMAVRKPERRRLNVLNPQSLNDPSHSVRLGMMGAMNPITQEEPKYENIKKMLIIHYNEVKTHVFIEDFLRLVNDSTRRFYRIIRTKIGGKYEKVIERTRVYVNITLPFNAIVNETDIMKIKPGGLQEYYLKKTNIKLGEMISQDVANLEGEMVGAHHGGGFLYKLEKK